MKTFPPSIALSLAVLGCIFTSTLSATTGQASGVIHPVTAVQARYDSNEDVVPGLFDFVVISRLGAPGHEPSRDIWIYHNMIAADDPSHGKHGCTNLVVAFKDRRVISLYLANEKVVQKIITQTKADPATLPAVLRLASN